MSEPTITDDDIALIARWLGLDAFFLKRDSYLPDEQFWRSLDAWQECVWPKLLEQSPEFINEYEHFLVIGVSESGVDFSGHWVCVHDAELQHASAAVRTIALVKALRERGAT